MSWHLMQYKGAFDRLWQNCPGEMKDSILPRLAQLAMKGNQTTFPVTDSFGDGLFEVRARYKRVRIRILFGFLPGQRIVFVWGGLKDQDKLSPETIELARRLLREAKDNAKGIDVAQFH